MNTYVIGFPKSGNTWLVRLLARALQQQVARAPMGAGGVDLAAAVNKEVPVGTEGYVYKIHWLPEVFFGKFDDQNKRIVYIVRDVRDVFVSSFFYFKYNGDRELAKRRFPWVKHWKTHFSARHMLRTYLNEFSEKGFERVGTWGEHVSAWSRFFDSSSFAVVRYEDLLKTPLKAMAGIGSAWGIEFDDARLRLAIEKESIDKLRNNAKEMHDYLNAFDEAYFQRFFRKGASGDWANYLTNSQERYLRRKWASQMEAMGYV